MVPSIGANTVTADCRKLTISSTCFCLQSCANCGATGEMGLVGFNSIKFLLISGKSSGRLDRRTGIAQGHVNMGCMQIERALIYAKRISQPDGSRFACAPARARCHSRGAFH